MQLSLLSVQQQESCWYVLDEEFPWSLRQVRADIISLIGEQDAVVIFCDTCEANCILAQLGEEEEEFLFPLAGMYQKERRLIFIFLWESYEQLLETLLHELRHHMQYQQKELRPFFYEEKGVAYTDRWIEQDARNFAKEKLAQYERRC